MIFSPWYLLKVDDPAKTQLGDGFAKGLPPQAGLYVQKNGDRGAGTGAPQRFTLLDIFQEGFRVRVSETSSLYLRNGNSYLTGQGCRATRQMDSFSRPSKIDLRIHGQGASNTFFSPPWPNKRYQRRQRLSNRYPQLFRQFGE